MHLLRNPLFETKYRSKMKKHPATNLAKIFSAILAILLFLPAFVIPAFAQTQTVNAVLFYSPTCGHCEKVINEDLPPLIEKFGSNLNIVGINVSIQEGQKLYTAAVERFEIPEEKLGVPCLIVGETVLVGSLEIPEQFPGIIENGIAQGGIPLPDVPGLQEALAASDQTVSSDPNDNSSSTNNQSSEIPLVENPETIGQPGSSTASFVEKFTSDLYGNILSVVILGGMLASVIAVGTNFSKPKQMASSAWPEWLIPILALIGLGVASYLSFVEVTGTEAVCGPVGNCNTVQQSPYASLFGILPVGILGVLGYVSILVVWIAKRYGPKDWNRAATILLWVLALFGCCFRSI
jgi:uncharacterized membrane protein